MPDTTRQMKYLFLILLCWSIGFALPYFTAVVQLIAGLVLLSILVTGVYYYIDTRINAVRL